MVPEVFSVRSLMVPEVFSVESLMVPEVFSVGSLVVPEVFSVESLMVLEEEITDANSFLGTLSNFAAELLASEGWQRYSVYTNFAAEAEILARRNHILGSQTQKVRQLRH